MNNVWSLKMGPIDSPETSVNKYVRSVKIQKNEDIIYTEAKI